MARYQATVYTDRSRQEVFDYLSDFSTTQDWDPGVVTAERLTGDAVKQGSEFSLVARFLGRDTQLTYRIVEYESPRYVVFLGENATVISRDRITFEPMGEGTNISYDAELSLKGTLRLADPLLGLAFKRVGDRALAGMRETLMGPLNVG
jgi:carbon monoxide dehydrogenase subunit G